jgi:hypothetical protein
VRLVNARSVRVTLRRSTRALPACTQACRSLKGSVLCVPPVAGIVAGEQGRYDETLVRTFTIETGAASAEMLHGSGQGWTLGIPYTGDVWESTDYAESEYQMSGQEIVDARGTAPGGRRWRYVGRFGESISYYEASPGVAAVFDRALNGVCAAR